MWVSTRGLVIVLQSQLGFAVCYNIFKTPNVKYSGTSSNSHLSTTAITFTLVSTSLNGCLSTMATFFCLQGGRCREVQLHVASDKLYRTIWQNSIGYAGNQPGICEVIHFGCHACILILLKICIQLKKPCVFNFFESLV